MVLGQAAALTLPAKPDPQILTNPVPLSTVNQQPEKNILKPKTKRKSTGKFSLMQFERAG